MQKYLIYQEEDGTLKRREIKDLEAAKKIAKHEKVKLEGKIVHIVGIGSDEDFRAHREITGQAETPAYKQLRANVAYFKAHGKWPR